MQISPEDWKGFFTLRDGLEDPDDRRLMRRLIAYAEYLEITMRKARTLLRIEGRTDNDDN